MPDPMRILEAMAVSAVAAAVVLLICGWPWRSPHARRAKIGGAVGVGLGFFLGCWLLGLRPHWPPVDDTDRLLLVVLPAAVAVEIAAVLVGARPWLAWLLRLAVAAGAAPILLHHTIYVADLAGPGSREWTTAQEVWILSGLAAALAAVWASLALLAKRAQGRWAAMNVPLIVALVACGAAIAVMLSGYATGGQMGLPLAAAIAGSAAASLLLSGQPETGAILGPGVVGLFALLVAGRFFGSLTTANAALLVLSPLLCWLLELPPRLRWLARLALVALPVAAAVVFAQRKFAENSAGSSYNTQEVPDQKSTNPPPSTIQDYMNFGK
jgi:hypothetical protein